MASETTTEQTAEAAYQPSVAGVDIMPLEALHLEGDAISKLADLGKKSAGATLNILLNPNAGSGLPEGIPVIIRHGDSPEVRSAKALVEEWRIHPERKFGTATALTLQSFIDLVIRHKVPDTAIFADSDWKKPVVQAVIDYHAVSPEGAPAWLKHRISYAFPLSEPWKAWIEQNGEAMEQAEFAAFLEDHIADLSSPEIGETNDYERMFGTKLATPAQLIQLSRGLQVFSGVEVSNAVTLQSGEGSIVFKEEHRDAAGNKLTVPGVFILNIAPFFMGELARIPVRLRYRLSGGKLKWFFLIYRPDLAVTDRVRADLDIIRRDTGLPVYEGKPEA